MRPIQSYVLYLDSPLPLPLLFGPDDIGKGRNGSGQGCCLKWHLRQIFSFYPEFTGIVLTLGLEQDILTQFFKIDLFIKTDILKERLHGISYIP